MKRNKELIKINLLGKEFHAPTADAPQTATGIPCIIAGLLKKLTDQGRKVV